MLKRKQTLQLLSTVLLEVLKIGLLFENLFRVILIFVYVSLTHSHCLGIHHWLVTAPWLLVLLKQIVKSLLLIYLFWLIFVILYLRLQKTFTWNLLTIEIPILFELSALNVIILSLVNIVTNIWLILRLINLWLRFWLVNRLINFRFFTFKLLLHLFNYHLNNLRSNFYIGSRIFRRR